MHAAATKQVRVQHAGVQGIKQSLAILEVMRVLRLTRAFKLVNFYKQSFDLIVSTFADSFTTLNTIVFLIMLAAIILSGLMFTAEATALDPLTHVRAPTDSDELLQCWSAGMLCVGCCTTEQHVAAQSCLLCVTHILALLGIT